MNIPELLTPEEVAEVLKIKPATVKNWRRRAKSRNTLDWRKIGGKWRITKSSLAAFVEQAAANPKGLAASETAKAVEAKKLAMQREG